MSNEFKWVDVEPEYDPYPYTIQAYSINPLSGRVMALQSIYCLGCRFACLMHTDMSFVNNDVLLNDHCPKCMGTLIITTYLDNDINISREEL